MDNMISHRIKARRKELKLTQVQIKELCGISNGNLSDFENGKKIPSANALIALSKALQVSTDWILKGEDHCCDIPNVILSSSEQECLKLFNELELEDQEEIIEMMNLKIKRKVRRRKSLISEDEIVIETA